MDISTHQSPDLREIRNAPSTVRELEFSDLYLGHPVLGNRLSDVPNAPANPVVAGQELREDLQQLHSRCNAEVQKNPSITDFKIEYDDVSYRVALMHSLGGDVFVLRRAANEIRSMDELGIPEIYQSRMLTEQLTGLLLIAGPMKSGKTSTACALIRERLVKYGGVAVTAEDPIELPLEGEHEPGVCFQTPVKGDKSGYADAARQMVRLGAKIILLGEIRDGKVAAEALRAGVNGHLVISTIHADDVQTAIRRLQAMASEEFDAAAASALMADGLAGVFSQKLTGTNTKRLEATMLMIKGYDSVRNAIRSGAYERLGNDINYQMADAVGQSRRA